MYRKYFDLILVAAISLIALMLTLAGVTMPLVMFWFGMLLVSFLPGYVLMQALTNSLLGKSERLLFSVGLSLLVTIVGGLLLNLTSWSLKPVSWVVWSCSITLIATWAAVIRRIYNTKGETPGERQPRLRLNWPQLGMLVLAVAVLTGAILISRSGAFAAEKNSTFTQLWVLPATQSGQTAVKVGIANDELTAVKYRLEVVIDNTVIKEWPSIDLAVGKEWEETANLPAVQTSTGRVEVRLYRLDAPDTLYRQVFLPLA